MKINKLLLNRETLRNISDDKLHEVGGAGVTQYPCPTHVAGCPPTSKPPTVIGCPTTSIVASTTIVSFASARDCVLR